ncbi:hypothetical protein BBK82_11865 [Lentzea guizhouensis]|uniref:Peptidase M48 domain-containing protein n=1 Tax=Lentzea guizhouensis TaxID=1586287 RepID=A0A1B2HFZ3_9PSEU|nr:hypothetical protein BBK82_11865 [Lentzea guizhouensis]
MLALVLLVGFFVLGAALTVFLVVVSVWRFRIGDFQGGGWVGFFAAAIAFPLLWAVVRAVFARPEPTGVPMTRGTHPELWRHVDELAVIAGTRSPDDIRLVPEPNANVWERRGTRYGGAKATSCGCSTGGRGCTRWSWRRRAGSTSGSPTRWRCGRPGSRRRGGRCCGSAVGWATTCTGTWAWR